MVRRQAQKSNPLREVFDESDESSNVSVESEEVSQRRSTRNQNQPSTSKKSAPPQQSQNKQKQNQQTQKKSKSSRNERQQPQPPQQKTTSHNRKNKFPKHIREIIRLQESTQNVIPKAPFARILREVLQKFGDFRMTTDSICAIHDATECYLVGLFDDAHKLTLHRKRVTIIPADITLALYLRGPADPGTR